jgi:hypothetical protein
VTEGLGDVHSLVVVIVRIVTRLACESKTINPVRSRLANHARSDILHVALVVVVHPELVQPDDGEAPVGLLGHRVPALR